LSDASLVIHHNGDKFDVKKLNARLIFHGLEPLAKITTIDTLKEARKIASFTSNRLDYLSKFFGGSGKIHNTPSLWIDVMEGSKKALRDMVAYNKVDVEVLEKVYNKLRPYMKNHPHVGAMKGQDKECTCRNCGSNNVKKNGIRFTAAGVKKQEIKCKDCHAYSLVKYAES
jgi:DNA polymerase III epsilon subunit-like protein